MSDGIGYAANHLEHRDYYAEGERVIGQWQGHGARLLGLAGEVRSEDFEALREGRDLKTGEFLRQRRSADRTALHTSRRFTAMLSRGGCVRWDMKSRIGVM